MQEVWQEIGESGSIYSRLWKFGMRALRSRECGLYEASDLLLGDHLLEKSESVVYVPVEMPHKRSRRLKNHDELVNLAEKNPDSEDIFMEDIVSCNYPNRPDDLEDLCLHDFVANYDSHSKDSQGRRIYRKVTKPRLVSQKMFDPKKEDVGEFLSAAAEILNHTHTHNQNLPANLVQLGTITYKYAATRVL